MGALCKLADGILFLFFAIIAVVAPLIDAQTCLPLHIFPDFLIDLKSWYSREYGDYLGVEKPNFFVGLVWLQLLFQWPLSILNLYAILANRSWLNTTCLIYGVSVFTSMFTILAELIGSRKASNKLLMMYAPFLGFSVIAILRGLVLSPNKTTITAPTRSQIVTRSMARKKKA